MTIVILPRSDMFFKKTFFIILVSLISSQLVAAPFCGLPYKNRPKSLLKEEMKDLKSLNRLDNMTNFIRRYKVKNSDTFSYIEKIKYRNNIIDTEVVSWNVDSAIRKWRPLFRKVEGSALYIDKYQKVLDALEDLGEKKLTRDFLESKGLTKALTDEVFSAEKTIGLEKYKKSVAKNIKKETKRLGNSFYEYQYVKGNLEKLEKLNCNPDCIAQLERLKREIGVTSASERNYFKELVGNRKDLKLSFVENIFHNNIRAFTTAGRVELFHEMASFLGSYAREVDLFWKVMKGLSEKSWVQQRRLARFFKAIYDKRARVVNDPLINQIVRVHSDPAVTLGTVKKKISMVKNSDDLLVDFSRREDGLAQKTWNELKDFASKNDKPFYNKMLKAEEIAGFLGRVASHIPRGFYYALGGAAVGASFILYFNFDSESDPPEEPITPPLDPKNTPTNLPGVTLPLYPDEDEDETDTLEVIILGEKDYGEMLEALENNADLFEKVHQE